MSKWFRLGLVRRGLAMAILCGAAGPTTKEKFLGSTRALSSPGQEKIYCLSRRKKGCNINPTTNPCNTNKPRLLLLLPHAVSISPMFGNGQSGLCLATLVVLLARLLPASPGRSWLWCPKQLLRQKGQCWWACGDAKLKTPE